MFSNEFDFDCTTITVLDDSRIIDDSSFYEDVKVELFDDIIVIKQWDDHLGDYQTIHMSPEMYRDLMMAMNQGEGVYWVKT